MKLLPCGDRAVLAEFDSLTMALTAFVQWAPATPAGITELVPAARTVLVRINPAVLGLSAAKQWLVAHAPSPGTGLVTSTGLAPGTTRSVITLPMVYDGDDLATVADNWGCSITAVVDLHAAIDWVCAFVGFAPGFSYLIPTPGGATLPPVPRRATSRPNVPAGAVALAAEYCGVYPRVSPGGWQLIGRTSAQLWDTDRASPALITAGSRVRFDSVRG